MRGDLVGERRRQPKTAAGERVGDGGAFEQVLLGSRQGRSEAARRQHGKIGFSAAQKRRKLVDIGERRAVKQARAFID